MPAATDDRSREGPSARRVPSQDRSRARIVAVLDATAALIDEVGPDAITTGLIATRANVSVGWLYDFFPNREAIFDAVMDRSIASVTPIVEQVHAAHADEPWQDVLGAVIDALFVFYRTDPGFRVLWFSRFQSAQMIQANVTHDLADARLALGRLERAGLHLDHPNPEAAMHLTIGIIDKGLDLAFRLHPLGDPAILAETKVAVCAHLERYVIDTPPSCKKRR
jgi:AcrR family transcriptional regulator